MGNLDWDTKQFPQPVEMIEKLKQQDVNTVLITEPFILTGSKKWQEAVNNKALGTALDGESPRVFDFFFGNTGLVDVFSKEGRSWFGNIYKSLADQGVAGVWGDLGEPEVHPHDMLHKIGWQNGMLATGDEVHNAYGHEWARLVRDALQARSPKERPFMIMRAGFAGSQRYGMLPWTGDVSRSWGGLKPQVELSLQMSLFGLAYTHSDLGGFAGGETFDQELYVRWLQYGVFQPIYRPHAQDAIAPEPVFHDKHTLNIVRDYINLRYRMLPYNYSLAYENSTSGMPLMRPMFFSHDKNRDWLPIKDQFFWGDSFLVKPVTEPNVESVEVLLPEGNWFDYWTGKRYEGGKSVEYPVDLTTLPVLVKGGAIIPMSPAMTSTKEYRGGELILDYYFDPKVTKSTFTQYEDDGKSADAIKSGAYELLTYRAEQKDNGLTLLFSKEGKGYPEAPSSRRITVNIHNWPNSNKGLQLDEFPMGSQYEESLQLLTVPIKWSGNKFELKLPL